MEGGPPRFKPDYTCPTLLRNILSLANISFTGLSPSLVTLSSVFYYTDKYYVGVLQPPAEAGFGLIPVRSPLLRESLLISIYRLLRCFSSPTIHPFGLCDITRIGFPHSEISGSKIASISPKLIAANHVLHRNLESRHPLYILRNFFLILVLTSIAINNTV